MMNIQTTLLLLWRATLLRCPICGKSKLFQRGFKMYDRCPHCGWQFEREEGYWTGAMGVNLVVTELLIAVVVVPLAAIQVPLVPLLIFGAPMPVLLPILFYRHSKAYWMTIDFRVHPAPVLRHDFSLHDIISQPEAPKGDGSESGT